MDTLLQDLRYTLRNLARTPGFTIAAVLALALGIGANSAIFSAVDALLLRPLPYPDSDRLVSLGSAPLGEKRERSSLSRPDFEDLRTSVRGFSGLGAFVETGFNLAEGELPERLDGAVISHDLFSVLGVKPLLGRGFVAAEEPPEGPRSAVISYELWQQRFGGDANILGRTLHLDGVDRQVVGVMPKGFRFPLGAPSQLWLPLGAEANAKAMWNIRGGHYLEGIGRLAPGVTFEQARDEAMQVSATLGQQYPDTNKNWRTRMVPLHESLIGKSRQTLWVLLGAVGFVLLLACANVANLLLARAITRQREIAIRSALGAGRSRLIRQLLTESLVLAFAGAALGLLLATWGVELLALQIPKSVPMIRELSVDGRVLAFTAAIAVATGVLFGLAPALIASRWQPAESMRQSTRSTTGGLHHRLRSILVAAEIAVALLLLVGAGLLVRSFYRLHVVDPGFRPEGLVTFKVSMPEARYPNSPDVDGFVRKVLGALRNTAGVESAATVIPGPFSGSGARTGLAFAGKALPEDTGIAFRAVSDGYFKTMGIPLLKGREFTPEDDFHHPRVVVVNEAFAKLYFPNENPIGQQVLVELATEQDESTPRREIVGVVADTRMLGLDQAPLPETFLPESQLPWPSAAVIVRTRLPQAALETAVRSELAQIDSQIPAVGMKPVEELLADSVATRRFNMVLLLVFAGVALVLAAVGVYGVMSYSVTQRTRELGIRMALGAQRGDVLRLVLGESMRVCLVGLLVGAAGALAMSRWIEGLLYQTGPRDPLTFAAIAALLAVVSGVATCFPR